MTVVVGGAYSAEAIKVCEGKCSVKGSEEGEKEKGDSERATIIITNTPQVVFCRGKVIKSVNFCIQKSKNNNKTVIIALFYCTSTSVVVLG